MTSKKTNKLKILNDPIYGFITIPNALIFDLIEHPYFQRLRRISQMGMSNMVYPGANHTRFHHAIGCMHLMQEAVPGNIGAMAAILGLDDETVIQICNDLNGKNVIEAVNFNSPGQVVVAGHRSIIEISLEKFKEAGARRALILPVSVPSHCRLMKSASVEFLDYLGDFVFNPPKIPIIHNVDVASYISGHNIKNALSMQLYNPIQWTRTIKYLSEKKMNIFVEGGPGRVLMGLNKRIVTEASHYSLDGIEAMENFLSELTT